MKENLFLIGTHNLIDETLEYNNACILKKALENLYFEQGYFFYFNKEKEELYYSKIISITKSNESRINRSKGFACEIKINNMFYQINFEFELEVKSINILKNIYAKRNKKFIGNKLKSIYYSLISFNYSFPLIDEINFKFEDHLVNKIISKDEDSFVDEILYRGSIIPDIEEKRKTFAKIVNEDGIYSFSLMNEKMLDKDLKYLLNENTTAEYRPYFYEFFMEESIEIIFEKYIKEGIYNEDKIYEIRLHNLDNEKIKKVELLNQILFKGEVMFSASPTRRVPAYLEIIESEIEREIIRKIKSIDKFINEKANLVKEPKDIENYFMSNTNIPKNHTLNINYEIKIFNVGQGNWIHITIYSDKIILSKIILDVGIGNKIEKNLLDSVVSQASTEIGNDIFFVLSHWDLDHIKGVTELTRDQLENTWIVPEVPEKARQSSKRLAAHLIINKNINPIFIPNSLNGEIIFENSFFELGKGYGNGEWHSCPKCKRGCELLKEGVTYTAENNLGLILVIKTQDKKMLFPGDCEYVQFPLGFKNQKYEALVAAHHGASIKQKDLEAEGFIACGKDKFAVVCVGEEHTDKDKSYPKESHEKSLKDLGFILHKTRDYKDVNKPCTYILD